ncbi:MAG: transposase [Bacteroidales bacterium]
MKYNPDIHHRHSIRLPNYDYSAEGLYFITICTHKKECLFGHIENEEMILNDAGRMVGRWYYEIENKFSNIKCLEMVVMPNHFHCIIQIKSPNTTEQNKNTNCRGRPACLPSCSVDTEQNKNTEIQGAHAGAPLHRVVQWFKTMSTNDYINGVKNHGWHTFDGKFWQRNYYEHIIRNDKAYQKILDYIGENPLKWNDDELNPKQN